MAIVLAASVPLGEPDVVRCRAAVLDAMFHRPSCAVVPCAQASLRHSCVPVAPLPNSCMYIGFGLIDSQKRPSPWANPFFFLESDPCVSLDLYSDYICSRADRFEFLKPLAGKCLLCDCNFGDRCHGHVLKGMVDIMFSSGPPNATPAPDSVGARFTQNSLEAENPGVPVVPDFDDDELLDDASDSENVVPHPRRPRILEDVRSINETVRGGGPPRVGRNPGWPAVWLWLISCIRAFTEPVMWEIFSGMAGLTHEFQRQGWPCAPPIDILYHKDFELSRGWFHLSNHWPNTRKADQVLAPRTPLF